MNKLKKEKKKKSVTEVCTPVCTEMIARIPYLWQLMWPESLFLSLLVLEVVHHLLEPKKSSQFEGESSMAALNTSPSSSVTLSYTTTHQDLTFSFSSCNLNPNFSNSSIHPLVLGRRVTRTVNWVHGVSSKEPRFGSSSSSSSSSSGAVLASLAAEAEVADDLEEEGHDCGANPQKGLVALPLNRDRVSIISFVSVVSIFPTTTLWCNDLFLW